MFLVVVIMHNPHHTHNLLRAWEHAGVPGATILDSKGAHRVMKGIRDDLPILGGLEDFETKQERRNRLIFSIVPNQEMIDIMREASQEVIGSFGQENTGLFFVVPIVEAVGRSINYKRGE